MSPYQIEELEGINLDSNLYELILCKIGEECSPKVIQILLKEHELNLHAKFLKAQFPNDTRTIGELKELIQSELSSSSSSRKAKRRKL